MKLNIVGITKQSKITKAELRRAAHFFSRCLLTQNVNPTITVTLKFDSSLRGSSTWGDAGFRGRKFRPKEYDIRLNPALNRQNMLRVLAHEMVHVKQWAPGTMMDYANGQIRFRRKKYSDRWVYSKKPWSLPWEQDAILKENILLELYSSWAMKS